MLLRHGRVYPKDNTWGQEHRRWLSRQQFEQEISAFVFADLVARVDGLTARKAALAERVSRLAADPEFWPTVARLRAFKGVDTLTALSIHLELGADWRRFEKPTRLGAWLGLTPSLIQSGESSRQGAITKTGSGLARRLLVESAWHYCREPRIGAGGGRRELVAAVRDLHVVGQDGDVHRGIGHGFMVTNRAGCFGEALASSGRGLARRRRGRLTSGGWRSPHGSSVRCQPGTATLSRRDGASGGEPDGRESTQGEVPYASP
jgi:hypothetical protein